MDLQNTTPELAHPAKRFVGQFFDGLIAYLLWIFAFYLFRNIIGYNVALFIASITSLAYFLFSDALANGQSIGKKLLDIRVIDKETMQPCSLAQSFLRNITFPLGIFDWIFIFFGSHRRLGDFIASTIVVKI